jgi:hypothetical protein
MSKTGTIFRIWIVQKVPDLKPAGHRNRGKFERFYGFEVPRVLSNGWRPFWSI